MAAAGELTEGYPAIATAMRFARERKVGPLPLLEMLYAVIWDDANVGESLAALRLTS
jgi:glycerol-3-phosphate dehydrogenase